MSKSRAQLIERTLQRLGVTGENRPAQPNETEIVDVGIPSLLDMLQKREIIYIGDADEIVEAAFEPLAVLLADAVKGFFGVAALPMGADGVPVAMQAEDQLRQIGYGRYSGAVQVGEYF